MGMAAGAKSAGAAASRKTGRVYVGIGGWDFAPWRGRFFPEGLPHASELEYASRQLNSIEINSTFYRTQNPAQFAEWHDAVPDDFVFAVKAHRAATAGRDPAKTADGVAHFLESGLDRLGRKLGPILWQFTNRRFDAHEMEAFLAGLPVSLGSLPLRHAIEARHESFAVPEWVALLRHYGVAQVIVDSDKQALAGDVTADFVYARLQRNAAGEREGYAPDGLDAVGRARAGVAFGQGSGRSAAHGTAWEAAGGARLLRLLHQRRQGARTRFGAGRS